MKQTFASWPTALLMLLWMSACGSKPPAEEPVVRPERESVRAYHGAPPVVPHDLEETGRRNCLSCHGPGQQNKGKAIAAVTPHPEWSQCQQCHVTRAVDTVFRPNTLVALGEPVRYSMSSPFIPPYIPHRLDNSRGDACETCHLGPSARTDLVPRHGKRENCRQCHLPSQPELGQFRQQVAPFEGIRL